MGNGRKISIVNPVPNGKYLVRGEEVLIHQHFGNYMAIIGDASNINIDSINPKEILGSKIQEIYNDLKDKDNALARKTNGLLMIINGENSLKEPVRNGESHVTIAKMGFVGVIPCRWIYATSENIRKLDEVFN